MDIHKPKPWHGLREFLKEYGIIVLGVLTALAFEEAARAAHDHATEQDARNAVYAEVRQNLSYMNGRLVTQECVQRRLDEVGSRDRRTLVEEARKKRVITALVALSQADPEFNILTFIDYLQDRGAFTPKQLALLLWRFEKLRVPFDVRDFKLTIRRDREKVQLLEMADWQIERLMPAMSPSQRQFLAEARSLTLE